MCHRDTIHTNIHPMAFWKTPKKISKKRPVTPFTIKSRTLTTSLFI